MIKVQSTVRPEEKLTFNEWMIYIYNLVRN